MSAPMTGLTTGPTTGPVDGPLKTVRQAWGETPPDWIVALAEACAAPRIGDRIAVVAVP